MSGVPKLSFRQNPLRLPVKKQKPAFKFSLDVEAQKPPSPKPKKDEKKPSSPAVSKFPSKGMTLRIIFLD